MTKVKVAIHARDEKFWWNLRLPDNDPVRWIFAKGDYTTRRSAERGARRWAAKHRFEIVEEVEG